YRYVQPHSPREVVEYPADYPPQSPADPQVRTKEIDYDFEGNMTTIKEKTGDPEDPMDDREITLRHYRWDEEGRLRAVDLKPENSANRPEIANYTYDADGQRTVRYVPGHVDAVYSGRNAGDKARVESFIYPSELLTVKTLSLKDVDNVIAL